MKMVGASVPKNDGLGHVTGTTKYVDDVYVPGTLICKGFRSPVSHGKIRSLDVSAAESMPGVYGVITYKDVPYNCYGGDWPVLAEKEVCFRGQMIAAVAAVDEDTAEEAVRRIKLDIEELSPVFDAREALKPGAPLAKEGGNVLMFGDKPEKVIVMGDVDEAFKRADYTYSCTYYYPVGEHAPMETQTSLVVPHPNGRITIYTNSQCLYWHLGDLSAILQLPATRINMIGGTVGGGFGGKNDMHADPVTALLALKTGRPVKWRWTREEELCYSTVRGAWYVTITDAVTKDGRIIGRIMDDIMDGGAFASLNLYASSKHSYFCVGPYYIPNTKVRVRTGFTNKVPSSSMRGFGLTGCAFAQEVQMDKLAEMVGMDPWKFRLINAFREGEPSHTSSIPDSVAAIEVLQQLAKNTGVQLSAELAAMKSSDSRG